MELIQIYTKVAEEGLPIPVLHCDNCQGTIYKKESIFKCPTCGAESTQYGGLYTHNLYETKEGDSVWVDLCNKSKLRIEELKNISV